MAAQGTPKETVLLIHGTFASPATDGAPQWYQPGSAFVRELDAQLSAAGSDARCWAHLKPGRDIFVWSGANNWQDRTAAARRLHAHLSELRSEGWRCHVIAHSHGGNILVDALKLIRGTPHLELRTWDHGNLVTLGTPFFEPPGDVEPVAPKLSTISKVLSAALFVLLAYSLLQTFSNEDVAGFLSAFGFYTWIVVGIGIVFLGVPLFYTGTRSNIFFRPPWPAKNRRLLVINSRYDEAWLALRQAAAKREPHVKPRKTLAARLRQTATTIRTAFAQAAFLDALKYPSRSGRLDALLWGYPLFLLAARSLVDPQLVPAFVWSLLTLVGALYVAVVAGYAFGRPRALTTALLAPLRLVKRIVVVFELQFRRYVFRQVTKRVSGVIRASTLGLDNFPFIWPEVSRYPRAVSEGFYEYIDIPESLARECLDRRGADLIRHVEALSLAASEGIVDPDVLFKSLASDTTTVHSLYYSRPELMAFVTDWIARSDLHVFWKNWGTPADKQEQLQQISWLRS